MFRRSERKMIYTFLVFLIFISFFIALELNAQEKGPIKVGFLLPYTGTMPLQAKGVNDGAELYFDEIGRKAGGRAIQIFKEDTEVNPTVALTKVKRLVEEKGVNFIIGPVSSAVALAIHEYVKKQKIILINPCAFSRDLTSPAKAGENIFRLIETTDQSNYPMGKWIVKNTRYRNFVITASDFVAGRHSVEAFKAGLEEAGGKVVKEVYPKLGTMDYAPFLPGIDVKGADAVYAWYAGTDAVRFVQQYNEFGLKKRLPLFGYNVIADDPYLASIGEAALDVITIGHYSYTLDTSRNRSFVNAYNKKYGEPPSRYSETGYTAAMIISAVSDALKGEIEDISKVAQEIKKIAPTLHPPSGSLAFDKYNQRIINCYIMKVEKKDRKLANTIIDRTGMIAQEDVWKWWLK